MNTNVILDAIGGIDEDLIENYFRAKETMKSKKRKSHGFKLGMVAAAVLLISVMAIPAIINFTRHNSHDPVTKTYESLNLVSEDLGFETLLSKLELDGNSPIRVSYSRDEEGNPIFSEPHQINVRQKYHKNPGMDNVHYYVIFGADDVDDSYIGGYEEQGLTKEINGTTVHYSVILDGSRHTQAKFMYEGLLYVVDITTDDENSALNYYLNLLLN